ncbi:hypothetical protein [Streptomyces hilarionis]|uniref:hypothetical protein n=1 Tax=Streptomyces hilarionis TaxID=2839954 RepID=UPI00211A6488|nr:hypothetical protein [Streptomyces hilarionis]MCQ9132697.1 hypothetical protein [Streptomyces hilarionis]
MGARSGGVSRLPSGAVAPDGIAAWDGGSALRWTRALPARGVPVRAPEWAFAALPPAAVAGAGLLGGYGGLPAWGAALVALSLVWPVLRPEAAAVGAPVGVVLVLTTGDGLPLPVRVGLAAWQTGLWAAVGLRLAARRRQRAAALAAAGGTTAVAPDGMGGRAPRGTFLLGGGLVLLAAGGVLRAVAALRDGPGGPNAVPAAGWCLAGLGLTVLLSAALARRRAVGPRCGPVPVLRVLARVNGDLETEVYAADDLAARRPLFTVSTADGAGTPDDRAEKAGETGETGDTEQAARDLAEAAGRANGPRTAEPESAQEAGDAGRAEHREADEASALRELVERADSGRAGPLREAVLYGTPYDGAEVVLLAAAAKDGAAPVVETSLGPVRPVTGAALRRRGRAERDRAVREGRRGERREAAVAAAAARAEEAGPRGCERIPRWRAGWADWLLVAPAALFLALLCTDPSWRGSLYGLAAPLIAALIAPRRLLWRITADRDGLWFNGLWGVRRLAWEDVRAVEYEGGRLRIRATRASFDDWRVVSFRWPWLERRLGVPHPYERTAAEITVLWRDPATRPAGQADERLRGRALWPQAVVLGALAAGAVVFLR